MSNKKSLTLRLVVAVFGIMAVSNVLTGLGYVVLSRLHGDVPVMLFRLINSPIQLLMLSVIMGTILSVLFSQMLLRPMNQLIDATHKVARGDFSVRVDPADSPDELGELVGSFNEMTRELGSNEMFKKDFINSFSHEFKTPIVSIRGFARQLERDDITDEERREYAGIIARESERLANMSANILLLTKLENQKIMPDVTVYRLDEQLREAILLLEKQWSDKELELDLDLPDTNICANEEMLSHVWINIIGNAVKFSENGGTLRVTCALLGEMVQVDIADTGVGMDEETCKRIFDKFYQGETTGSAQPSHSTEGNGLGLPLARRIVELSGGSIKVISAPGRGSTFTVTLPAV
jgi:signal transduction histidine kinase